MTLINRSGNRPSHEVAAAEIDRAIGVCRAGGFRQMLVRGDTDFTQTKHLDRWDSGGVQFPLRRQQDSQSAHFGR